MKRTIILCLSAVFLLTSCSPATSETETFHNESMDTVTQESNDELIPFDFTADEFETNFSYYSSVPILKTEYIGNSYVLGFESTNDEPITTVQLQLDDSSNNVLIIAVTNIKDNNFYELAKAAIFATNSSLDIEDVMNQLDMFHLPTSLTDLRTITIDGIEFSLSNTSFSIFQRSSNMVSEETSSTNSEIFNSSNNNQLYEHITNNEYYDMLVYYNSLFMDELSVTESTSDLANLISSNTSISTLSDEIANVLRELDASENTLKNYYSELDKNREQAPYGTKIMSLLINAQSCLRQYAMALEHLQDYIYSFEQKDLDDYSKYMEKCNESLDSYNSILNSELSALGK